MLVEKNILQSEDDLTYIVFTNYITDDFLSDPSFPKNMKPSEYVAECWNRYVNKASAKTYKRNNNLNGSIFEVIIATALYRYKVRPFYFQAKARLVPDVDYDIILYDRIKGLPITISIKTSVRERYKQAALEAYAFKNVHRTSRNYLVLLDHNECVRLQTKIDNELVLGLYKAVQADTDDFDKLIKELKKTKYGMAPKITLFDGYKIK